MEGGRAGAAVALWEWEGREGGATVGGRERERRGGTVGVWDGERGLVDDWDVLLSSTREGSWVIAVGCG